MNIYSLLRNICVAACECISSLLFALSTENPSIFIYFARVNSANWCKNYPPKLTRFYRNSKILNILWPKQFNNNSNYRFFFENQMESINDVSNCVSKKMNFNLWDNPKNYFFILKNRTLITNIYIRSFYLFC